MREQLAMEVPADAAYAAARDRAVRTTEALILAEAQAYTLHSRVAQLESQLERVTRERDELLEPTEEEVTHDAASHCCQGADARVEVGSPHPFSD